MSVEKKNPLKRDQALNDVTNGQIGGEPRSEGPVSDLKTHNRLSSQYVQGSTEKLTTFLS